MTSESATKRSGAQYDAIIIGAGVSGLYQLKKLRELGLKVRVFEAGTGVGGTWYWNRYPGARFDSESWSYGYSFSEELLQEWDWSEHFAAQPETLAYLNFVADKFDLRKDIEFNTFVSAARYDDSDKRWTASLAGEREITTRFLITAIGAFSVPTWPNIPGRDDFAGESYHTARWPHEAVDFSGKRVAVVGTGATGVQLIQEVAKTAGHLTVFQRTPNWCAPLMNSPISDEEQADIKRRYPEIMAQCNDTFAGFIHDSLREKAVEVNDEEREAQFEKLYNEPGFSIWMGNYRDLFVDTEANQLLSDFVAKKIRERVNDPKTAEKLIPTNHGFGSRRVPMETKYYEVYNQPNVDLIDVKANPITRITRKGVETSESELEFDMIVYATGFDAILGGFNRIDIQGVNGQTLKAEWSSGPRTYLGLQAHGFPNMFTLVGPHNAATFCNMPRCIEQNVDWVTDLIVYMRDNEYRTVEPNENAVQEWTQHVYDSADRMLLSKTDSWFTSVNSNLEGRSKRNFVLYAGGFPGYRKRCEEIAADGYAGFHFE